MFHLKYVQQPFACAAHNWGTVLGPSRKAMTDRGLVVTLVLHAETSRFVFTYPAWHSVAEAGSCSGT
jgi:hypothetical protein